jgi:hypothetical protein
MKMEEATNLTEYRRVIFHKTDTANSAQFVSINGFSFLIPRDKEVEIPTWVLRSLDDDVTTRMDPETREEHHIKRMPYTDLGPVTAEAAAAKKRGRK